jgi:putative ATP-binding cassette transporter
LWYISFLFAVLGSWGCFWVGRKLWGLQYANQKKEADFRYHLVKLRDDPRNKDQAGLTGLFKVLTDNYVVLYKNLKWFGFARSTYFQAAIIVPFIVVAPAYFSGAIGFGVLMQIVHAFGVVNTNMSYLLDNYLDITKLKSVSARLIELTHALEKEHEKN